MSLKVRVYGKDDIWFQLFSNNEFPEDFKEFLKKNNANIDQDGCCDKVEVNTAEFIEHYEKYIEDIAIWCLDNDKQILPLDPLTYEKAMLPGFTISDELLYAMDSSAVMQLYFLWRFLEENDIAKRSFGDKKIFKDTVEIEVF